MANGTQPVDSMQTSSVHTLSSAHKASSVSCTHTSLGQESTVHSTVSTHVTVFTHCPATVSQVSTVHWRSSLHSGASGQLKVCAMQRSSWHSGLQLSPGSVFPSSQVSPSSMLPLPHSAHA